MRSLITLLLAAALTIQVYGQETLCEAGQKLLSALTADQRKKALFDGRDEERMNWNFVPVSRRGLPVGDLNELQTAALHTLLRASLSDQGYTKASSIPTLEGVLRQVEGRGDNDSYRDPRKYFISIFGSPACRGIWHWRLEGHHLSLNFSVIDGTVVSSTPSFMGANPAVVPSGPRKGWQVLQDETALAFALIGMLSEQQLEKAVFSNNALPEIVTGNDRRAALLEPAGITYRDLTPDQKKAFIRLLDVFIRNYEFGFSSRLWEKIEKAGLDNLSFAWAGKTTPGSGTYYRIQGPMLQIEYDNTQSRANHVHTAVRDLTNDFAEDILRAHYRNEH